MPLTEEEAMEEMQRRQRIIDANRTHLLDSGHTCLVEYDTFPSELFWCHATPCNGQATD